MNSKPNNSGDPARLAVHAVLMEVLGTRIALDTALNSGLQSLSNSTDRRFAHRLVMTVLRNHGALQAVIGALLERPLPAKAIGAGLLLEMGLAQMLLLDVPDHAAIDATVSLSGPLKLDRYRGLTNAVLRRAQRERAEISAVMDDPLNSVPDWLRQRWDQRFGPGITAAIAEAVQQEPPLDISVASDPDDWAARLDGRVLDGMTVRRSATGVAGLEGFDEGRWWVQDAAAALPARLLLNASDGAVIDLCAAPGGKTAQLLAAGRDVTAVEKSKRRIRRLKENLARLDQHASIVEADAATWEPPGPCSAILVDAPCSATGTIRRRPDIPWTKSMDDIRSLTEIQAAILGNAVRHLKPGGVLVYAVCSLEQEEGPDQIARALTEFPGLVRLPIDEAELGLLADARTAGGDAQTLPCHLPGEGGVDGFYVARLRRA